MHVIGIGGGSIGKISYWRTYHGEKKQIKIKNGKKTYWRTFKGEKKMVKMACDWNRGGQYWQNILLEDLSGGRPPLKLKKTRDIGATPRSQTNFVKTIKIEYIDPKKSKKGGILAKKPTGGLIKGEKKNKNGKNGI